MPKLKKILKKYKKIIILAITLIIIMVLAIVLYKTFFYSNREADIYGVRLRDLKQYEFKQKEREEVEQKANEIEGVGKAQINVKGRLIKVLVYFDDNVSTEEMKVKFGTILDYINDEVKSYYDITLYAKQDKEEDTVYPIIGYKHKSSAEVNYEVF